MVGKLKCRCGLHKKRFGPSVEQGELKLSAESKPILISFVVMNTYCERCGKVFAVQPVGIVPALK